jgi:hypothetical protein
VLEKLREVDLNRLTPLEGAKLAGRAEERNLTGDRVMKCYVLGAGVSKSVGYPLGSELFDEIDKFIRESGACIDRFDYRKDWGTLHHWLETNTDPIAAQAYRSKNIEHIFTVLDFAIALRDTALWSTYREKFPDKRNRLSTEFDDFDKKIEDYQKYRGINPDGGAKLRLGSLFQSGGRFDGAVTFEEWASLGCPETVPWRPKAKAS